MLVAVRVKLEVGPPLRGSPSTRSTSPPGGGMHASAASSAARHALSRARAWAAPMAPISCKCASRAMSEQGAELSELGRRRAERGERAARS